MARPTSLTPELARAICISLRNGSYREQAAACAGIHRNTLRNWLVRGEAGEEPFAGFLCALEKAEAIAERRLLSKIRRRADGWQALAWIMERRWPSRWSGRVRVTVSDHVDQLTAKL
jgi:transposase